LTLPRTAPTVPFVEATGTQRAPDDEVVGLLARLLRADTSNPPGDVRPAAGVLHDYFRANGLEPVVLGEADDLPNLVVRLPGSRGGPALLLLGHLDVVPADAREWSVPPFEGTVRDGFVWGRGALDMKNQLAAQAVALVRLARASQPLRGDLVYAATADEETGVRCGAAWLFREHPGLVCADFCINEGGLDMFHKAGRPLYTIHVGEKGYANCRITFSGRPGHGSVPLREGTALQRLAAALKAVQAYEPEVSEEFLPVAFIEQAVEDPAVRHRLTHPGTAQAAVRELAKTDPGTAAVIEPLLGLTFAPTGVHAGEAVNVIPGTAQLVVDCRTLPGQGRADVRRELERALAGLDAPWELEFFGTMAGSASPAATPFRDAVEDSLHELVPDAVVVEALFSGFTDSAHVRSAFPGTVAYGFCPFVEETGDKVRPRLHGIDERISVRDLGFQAAFLERLARHVVG
jgi:acetylornithine deacetylase/succinyl-diaminopimelate desuccinylase-like protein